MHAVSDQAYDIQVVARLEPCDSGLTITFLNGSIAIVPADHADYALILLGAEDSLRNRQPVGMVLTGTGRIIDLHRTYPVTVRELIDDRDGNRLMVGCWGFCPYSYLPRDHLDFERIRTALEEAVASQTRVWLANWSWPVEGNNEVWNKIMDVRPELWPVQAQLWKDNAAKEPNGTQQEPQCNTPASRRVYPGGEAARRG
jgi:hypothetical protein